MYEIEVRRDHWRTCTTNSELTSLLQVELMRQAWEETRDWFGVVAAAHLAASKSNQWPWALMSTKPTLSRQIRSTLEDEPDALPIIDLLVIIDEFIVDCTKEKEPEILIFQLHEDLHSIYREVVDCTSLHQTEIFLAVLYHLGPLLPPNSVVSWFDLLLRPALREPKLSNQAVTHAKEIIITALQKSNEIYTDKVGDFRRQLIELYLFDAFNDGSCDDHLEWAELNAEERQKRTFWKYNLEDILVKFGNEGPEVRTISAPGLHFLYAG